MDDMKTHEWCAAYPHAAADEIKRLETALRSAEEDKQQLNGQVRLLQDACRDCSAVAHKVANDLQNVRTMLQNKGL